VCHALQDKLNFKAPGGAGFLCHQDATAYATGDLASRHVSAMVAVDAATVANGAVQVRMTQAANFDDRCYS